MSAAATALAKWKPRMGQHIGASNWIEVTQARIDAFADITVDDQWIHLDAERAARETPFGGTIAHGFLSLSLASRFAYDVIPLDEPGQRMGVNYGFDRLRFVSPVRAGNRLRGQFQLLDLTLRKPTELQRKHLLTVEIEGAETPAIIAEWLSLAIFDN